MILIILLVKWNHWGGKIRTAETATRCESSGAALSVAPLGKGSTRLHPDTDRQSMNTQLTATILLTSAKRGFANGNPSLVQMNPDFIFFNARI